MPIGSLIGGMISSAGAREAGSTAAAAGNQAQQQFSPWVSAGQNALSRLNSAASGDSSGATEAVRNSPGMTLSAPYLEVYGNAVNNQNALVGQAGQALGVGSFQTSPGYQFRLTQGQNALANSASARGMTLSGAQAKALTDYNQGAASAEYQNWANNYLNWLRQAGDVANQYGDYARTGISTARGAVGDYYGLNQNLAGMGLTATDRGVGYYMGGQNALASSQARAANSMATGVSDTLAKMNEDAKWGVGTALGFMSGGMSGSPDSKSAVQTRWA